MDPRHQARTQDHYLSTANNHMLLYQQLLDKNVFYTRLAVNEHTHINVSQPFVWDYPGGPVPEGTFTHSHPSWSSCFLYHLSPSTMIHSILLVQYTCLTVLFHNLSLGYLWSTSWSGTLYFILHIFLYPIIIYFSRYMPIPSQPPNLSSCKCTHFKTANVKILSPHLIHRFSLSH